MKRRGKTGMKKELSGSDRTGSENDKRPITSLSTKASAPMLDGKEEDFIVELMPVTRVELSSAVRETCKALKRTIKFTFRLNKVLFQVFLETVEQSGSTSFKECKLRSAFFHIVGVGLRSCQVWNTIYRACKT